jgi:hypothetical protein
LPNVDYGLWSDGDVAFNIRKAVALGVDNLAIAVDAKSAPRRSWFCQIGEDSIDGGISGPLGPRWISGFQQTGGHQTATN